MLLGDRNFIDNEVSDAFTKTSSYHVLVIAGLHVAALAAFVVWICDASPNEPIRIVRRFSLRSTCILGNCAGSAANSSRYADGSAYLLARAFFRRLDILQTAAVVAAAHSIFSARRNCRSQLPIFFSSDRRNRRNRFALLDYSVEPLRHALYSINDETRDRSFMPRLVQFRLDLRAIFRRIRKSIASVAAPASAESHNCALFFCTRHCSFLNRSSFLLSIQLGLTPLFVEDFHRVAIVGLFANIPAVLLTAVIVPLGFATVGVSFVSTMAGHLLARFASGAVFLLFKVVHLVCRHALCRLSRPQLSAVACVLSCLIPVPFTVGARTRNAVCSGRPQEPLCGLLLWRSIRFHLQFYRPTNSNSRFSMSARAIPFSSGRPTATPC